VPSPIIPGYVLVRADGHDPVAAHGEGLGDGPLRIDRDHLAAQEDQVGLLIRQRWPRR